MACGDDEVSSTSVDVGVIPDTSEVSDAATPDTLTDTGSEPDAVADVPTEVSSDVTLDVPQEVIEDAPSDVGADGMTDVSLEDGTETTPDATPDTAPDTAPDVSPDGPVDVALEVTSDVVEDAPVDAAPDVVEDATVDAAPDIVEDACITGADQCLGEQFCLAAGCGAGLDGVCTFKPQNCDDALVEGVCGCDGSTYLNTCVAHQSGVAAAGPGACPEEPVVCTVAVAFGLGEGCEPGQYCMGGCEGEGICMAKASGCDDLGAGAVCSCSNNTYASPCWAASSGANVDYAGSCEGSDTGPPQACGGDIEEPCPEGKHCDISGCDPANTGICQGIWQGPGVPGLLCLPGDPAECGCDGVTYLNKCQRILADAAKDYVGACGENTCELGVEDDCGVGLYCSGPTGSCSGAGSCLATSFLCLESGPAVCGCDGETYTSACHAHQKDVPLASLGECP